MVKELLLGTLLFSTISAYAQDEQSQINKIKSDMDFLYAMGTSSSSADDAVANAQDLIS
jgi:hypothetical protein